MHAKVGADRARKPSAPAEGCVLTLPFLPLAKEWLAMPDTQNTLDVSNIMRPQHNAYTHAAVAWTKGPTLGTLIRK